jgi:hypothetical protein
MEYEVKHGNRRSSDSDWQSVSLGYHPVSRSSFISYRRRINRSGNAALDTRYSVRVTFFPRPSSHGTSIASIDCSLCAPQCSFWVGYDRTNHSAANWPKPNWSWRHLLSILSILPFAIDGFAESSRSHENSVNVFRELSVGMQTNGIGFIFFKFSFIWQILFCELRTVDKRFESGG